jgi:hypothetical protein
MPKVRKTEQELEIASSAVALCFLLATVMIVSEIIDPEIGIQGGDLGNRLLCIAIAVAIMISSSIGKSIWPNLLSLTASSIFISLDTIRQVYFNGFTSFRLIFTSGKSVNDPNYLALYLCLGLGPCLSLAAFTEVAERKVMYRSLLLVSSICIVIGVVLTTSRMGIFVVAMMITLVLIRLMVTRPLKFIVVAGSLILLSIYLYEPVTGLPVIVEMRDRLKSNDVTTASDRTNIAVKAMNAFGDMGIGQKLFGGGSQANYTLTNGVNTHNGFLEYLLDHGILGAGFLVCLFIVSALSVRSIQNLPLSVATWSVWLTLFICTFSLSPFVRAWGWVALAPLLLTKSKRQRGLPLI